MCSVYVYTVYYIILCTHVRGIRFAALCNRLSRPYMEHRLSDYRMWVSSRTYRHQVKKKKQNNRRVDPPIYIIPFSLCRWWRTAFGGRFHRVNDRTPREIHFEHSYCALLTVAPNSKIKRKCEIIPPAVRKPVVCS